MAAGTYPTSPAWKLNVRLRPEFMKTPILAWPETYYCHSSSLGCQCSSRMAPGSISTRAADVVYATATGPGDMCDCVRRWLHGWSADTPQTGTGDGNGNGNGDLT